MDRNRIGQSEELRRWVRGLEKRPGVYLIENTVNGACYVGSSKSLRSRLGGSLSALNSGKYDCYLLQADWQRYGAERFIWWASYSNSEADALWEEIELVAIANAFEDFGGYCQRTGKNCAAASFRDTERKLAKAPVQRYQFLPGVTPQARINWLLLRTFRQTRAATTAHLELNQSERINRLLAWKSSAMSSGRVGHHTGRERIRKIVE